MTEEGGRRRLLDHPAARWAERALLAAALVFVLVRLGPQLSAWTGIGPVVGDAPSWELRTLDGEILRSDDLDGRTVVVNFWATWCGPCRLEIPALQAVHEDFGEQEVVVVGISTDVAGEGAVREYLEERGVTYPVGMATSELRRAFGGITALPTTFIVDGDGVVQHRVLGLFAPPAMRAAVRRSVRRATEER